MAEPTGEHVVRGGKEGGLNQYNYDPCNEAPFAGWASVEENSGAVGMTGDGGDGFAAAMKRGNGGHPQSSAQV